MLKFQYFDHLMWRAGSLEKALMLGKIEGRRRRGRQEMRWSDGIIKSMDMSVSKLWEILRLREAWGATVQSMESQRVRHDWVTQRTAAATGEAAKRPEKLQWASRCQKIKMGCESWGSDLRRWSTSMCSPVELTTVRDERCLSLPLNWRSPANLRASYNFEGSCPMLLALLTVWRWLKNTDKL